MLRVQKLVKLKGKVNSIVREQYLRDDIKCQSPLCKTCQSDAGANSTKGLLLHKDVTHYGILSYDVVQKFLEIFEVPEMKGIIFLQTIALKVLQSLGRNRFRRILSITKDVRHGSVIFLNEMCKHTSCERTVSQSEEEWLARSTLNVAEYYDKHLQGAIPIYIVSEKLELFRAHVQEGNIKVVNVKTYLETMWPDLKDVQDLYESICASSTLQNEKDSSKLYDSHLPVDVLEAGVKAGRFIHGIIHVNKHISSQEAYVTPSRSDAKDYEDVLIVGMKDRNRAIHGDDVVVELLPRNEWKSRCQSLVNDSENIQENGYGSKTSSVLPTGKVVGVLDRRWRDYVATFPEETEESTKTSRTSSERVLVWPYDYRIPKIRIATKQTEPLRNQRIVVRIDGWEKDSQYPNGHFVRTLGEIGVLETEVQALLVEHGVSTSSFPANLLPELPTCTESDPWCIDETEVQKRKDLRSSHLIFSIDPKGCEDVDDALSVRHLEGGMLELGVHIADVTHFVKESSLTDLEARSKSTSVYLPDRRYDMLPHVLSGNLCSLLGNVDRYAVSVLWTLDSKFEVQDVWYGRTVICSSYKLCYEDAQEIATGASIDDMRNKIMELQELEGKDLHTRFTALKDAVVTLLNIASAIRNRRLASGGLELNSINMKFEIDKTLPSVVQDFKQVEELEIHKTVAECMIFANHWVAKKIADAFPQQAVLRHHPHPKESTLVELQKLAAARGFSLKIGTNKELAASLEESVDPENPVVNQIFRLLATRAMNEATYICSGCYKPEDFYHYGLGISYYTHFTSPIRRYADVMVHRLLLASVGEQSEKNLMRMADIESLCQHMNEKHRAAQDVEKHAQELFLAFYFMNMHSEKNDEECLAEAVIYSMKANGVLVYLPQYGIKGAVCLCDRDKKVALVKDSITWTDGQLEVKPTELIVKTTDCSQRYALFDIILVHIKVQMPRAHQPKLVFEIAKKHSFVTSKCGTSRVKSHEQKQTSCKKNEGNEVNLNFEPSTTVMDGEDSSENKQNLYHFLQCFREMTLMPRR